MVIQSAPLDRGVRLPGWVSSLVALALLASLSVAGAAALHLAGMAAIHGVFVFLLFASALAAPRRTAVVLLAALVVIEPNAFDLTVPLSVAWHEFPAGVAEFLPMQLSPIEVASVLCLGSALLRPSPRAQAWARVPWLAGAVPVVLVLGALYGYARGGDPAIAYHEMRGLLFAIVAFALAVEVLAADPERRWQGAFVFGTTAALAVVLIARYYLFIRTGETDVPPEFAYAHESVLFLGAGFAAAVVQLTRARWPVGTGLLTLHALLMVAATLVTGRRLGILVLAVIGVVLLALMIRRRPLPALLATLVCVSVFGGYLAAYWGQSYGALAQPARAVRSQFDPNLRDLSSDTYREVERVSVEITLRSSPAFGVGFGRPFIDFGALPRLQEYWPLQFYTPHQNVLWLWLKMGLLGASVILGLWVLAAGRAIRAVMTTGRESPPPMLAMFVVSLLAAHLAFASLDVTYAVTRAAAPLGVLLALAFVSLAPFAAVRRGADASSAPPHAPPVPGRSQP